MTILGGAAFLGLQVYEWSHLIHRGMSAQQSNYAATFFLLTGFHGLHVTIGVIYLSCIWTRAKQRAYTAEKHSPVELVGLYWHFVDLVWIVLFTIIYLIPDSVT
jgi:heme/copper-type cytochrome/quinol oxidase subunit 3